MMIKKRKLLYYNYIIPALWSQQSVVLLIIISQLQFLSLCKSLAYLLLCFSSLLVLVVTFLLLYIQIVSDNLNRDYFHRLFSAALRHNQCSDELHKYIILSLCSILRFFTLPFSFKIIPFSPIKQRLFTFTFRLMTKTEIVFIHYLFSTWRFNWVLTNF